MATYKVIQDVEAEDKLVGPLTLRQFIYACIAAVCAYLSFVALGHGFALALLFLGPPMIFTGFFAFPWGRDQPTEVWALAKIRYYLKARKRLWDQSGVKDLVTITAPKRAVRNRTNGLSANEVQSRLTALANTLDSRGWAVKNVNVNLYASPLAAPSSVSSDRLIDISSMPQPVPTTTTVAADDIMDTDNNPHAHQVQEMVAAASSSHKQSLLDHMQRGDMPNLPTPAGQPNTNYWFTGASPTAPQASSTNDMVLSDDLREHAAQAGNTHLKTIAPLPAAAPTTTPPTSTPPTADPAIMHLSQRDDLNISTIARIAKGEDSGNEVVISLR